MAAGRMIQIPRSFSPDGVIYSTAVRSLQDLRDNDEAAAAEAEAQKGVPGYCGACLCVAVSSGLGCGTASHLISSAATMSVG